MGGGRGSTGEKNIKVKKSGSIKNYHQKSRKKMVLKIKSGKKSRVK